MAYFKYHDLNIFYEVKGNVDAQEVLIFFNGVMASTNSWDPILSPFLKKYKIICHDFIGQLHSDKPKRVYTFKEHIDHFHALLEELGISSFHLVGTSYGAEVGMKYAMIYPHQVKSLTIIAGVSETDECLKGLIRNWQHFTQTCDGEQFFWRMACSIYHPEYLLQNKEWLANRAKALKDNPKEYLQGQYWLYETFLKEVNFTQDLPTIQCPVLIVAGEQDLLKPPRFSQLMKDKLKQARYVVIPNAAHVLIFEASQQLQMLIYGFINIIE